MASQGGYNVTSVVNSAQACVEVLLGDEPKHLSLLQASASATMVVQDVIRVQSEHWKCMGPKVESPEGTIHLHFPPNRAFIRLNCL